MRVVAAVVLCLILCALPAQAQTGADAQIEIFPPDGGAPTTLAYSQLGEPDRDGAYSLANVLRRAGVHVGTYDRVEVARPDGSVVAIPRGEIRLTERKELPTDRIDDPTATLEQRYALQEIARPNPVVLRTGAGGVELLRPVTTGNPTELVLAAVDGRLTLRAVADERVVANPRTARPGATVAFVATPPAGTVYATVQYAWDFGDGATATGAEREVTHVYEEIGTRSVTVRFLRDGQPIGDATTIVYVNDPSLQGTGNARPGARRARRRDVRKADADGGGGGGGGGTGGGAGAGTGGGGSGSGTWDDEWAAPPVDAAPPADTPVEPVTPPEPEPEPEPRPRRIEPAPEPEPAGEVVDGYLLASADLPGAGGGAEELPADAPQELQELARRPTEAATHGRTLPTVAWVGIGLVALLALGWALEGRRTLPYWQP